MEKDERIKNLKELIANVSFNLYDTGKPLNQLKNGENQAIEDLITIFEEIIYVSEEAIDLLERQFENSKT